MRHIYLLLAPWIMKFMISYASISLLNRRCYKANVAVVIRFYYILHRCYVGYGSGSIDICLNTRTKAREFLNRYCRSDRSAHRVTNCTHHIVGNLNCFLRYFTTKCSNTNTDNKEHKIRNSKAAS